jgi:hypothetical protein
MYMTGIRGVARFPMNERPAIQLSDNPAAEAPGNEITFVGTATTIIQVAGFTILTDPNFLHRGERAGTGPGRAAGRRRWPPEKG